MKTAAIQQGMNATQPSNQTWLDAGFSNDVAGALFFSNQPTANDVATNQIKFGLGATDFVNSCAAGLFSEDGISNARTASYFTNANAIIHPQATGVDILAAYGSLGATGPTMAYTAATGTQYLENCILIGGSDQEMRVNASLFALSTNNVTITHRHGGLPEAMVLIYVYGLTAMPQNFVSPGIVWGLWDGTNSVGLGFQSTSAVATTDVEAYLSSADLGHCIQGGVDRFTLNIANVNGTTFDITRTGAPAQGAVICITFRHKTGNAAYKAGVSTAPLGTGPNVFATGMSLSPQLGLFIPTRLQATDTLVTAASAGGFGFGASCNKSGVTQQLATAISTQGGLATMAAKSRTTQSAALLQVDNTGAVTRSGVVNSWDSGGITVNNTVVTGNPDKGIYLLMGQGTAAPSTLPIGGIIT